MIAWIIVLSLVLIVGAAIWAILTDDEFSGWKR